MAVTYLSASALSAQRECPMQFYGRYVQRWPSVYPPIMVQAANLGMVTHGGLEAFHAGLDPIVWLCENFHTFEGPMPPNAFEKAVRLIRVYAQDERPDSRDVIEDKFSITIPGVAVPIIGYIDVQRGLVARELKTTGSKTWWTPERARTSLQTSLYSMALSRKHRGAQSTVEHHILNHNGGQYTHTVLTNSFNKSEIQECEEGIRATWSEIQRGELNAVCKPGKCRFPTQCKEFGYRGADTLELALA